MGGGRGRVRGEGAGWKTTTTTATSAHRLLHEVGEHARGPLGHPAEDLQVEVRVGRLRVLRVELARLVADELDAQAAEEGEHLLRAAPADEPVLHVAPREAQVALGRDELAQEALLVRLLPLDALAHLERS